jgi:hypothetical protein
MAITQTRVIRLIGSAQDYQRALEEIVRHIHAKYQYATSPEHNLSAFDALHELVMIADVKTLLKFPIQSPNTIAAEHHHFVTNFQRNKTQASYMKSKRQRAGKEKRNTYDPSVDILSLLDEEPKQPKPTQPSPNSDDPELIRQWNEAERNKREMAEEEDKEDTLANQAFSNWKPDPSS